jgi:hypothetical protein
MKKKKFSFSRFILKVPLWILLLVLRWADGSAQTFMYQTTLVSVSFSGVNQTNYIPIRYDNGTGTFEAPQYIKASNTQSPVAYVSGTKSTVSAIFRFMCEGSGSHPANIWIRGKHKKLNATDTEFNYIKKQVPFGVGVDVTYPATAADKIFTANKVDFYNYDYNITWEYSISGSDTGSWISAGESKSPIYITFKAPKDESPADGYMWFQTLLHHACVHAKGQITDFAIYKKVRDYYKGKAVTRGDGHILKYYGIWIVDNTTTASLIKNGDGQCGSWASMFIDVLKTQGIQSPNNYTTIESTTMFEGFYVKTWKAVTATGSTGNSNYPFLNIWKEILSMQPITLTGYSWVVSTSPGSPEVKELLPLDGQNNPTPNSRFGNHQFVKMFSEYFDPSYGVIYTNTTDMDNALTHLFRISPFVHPDGVGKADFIRKNPTGVNIIPTNTSY